MNDEHCFISYSNRDAKEFGPQLSLDLEGGHPHIETWYDKQNIPPGADWDDEVPEAIKTCKCFLFVLTKDSTDENSICMEELDYALTYKKPIFVLRILEDVEPPFRLKRRQWIDFTKNHRASMAQLRQAILRLDTTEGHIRALRDRLADANRDLINTEDNKKRFRIQAEIEDINSEIKLNETVQKDPDKARKQTRKNINAGLERDRQPLNPVGGETSSKFINPRPGSIPDYFEGRLIETQKIAVFLRNDNQRIMTIIGRAGSGKTVLTCRVLKQLESGGFPNDLGDFKVGGIVYLSERGNYKINVPNIFAGLLQLIPSEEAKKIDAIYREPKKPIDEKVQALLKKLPHDPIVLLLDNFEDLLDIDNETINDQELNTALTTILQADKHSLKIIITTRVIPRQLSMIEAPRQLINHLKEGLPAPFAENVLRKMDTNGQAGLRDATDELLGRVREATLGYPRALEAVYAILQVDSYSNVEEILAEGTPETVVEQYVGEAFSRLNSTKQKIIQALAIYNRPVSHAAIDFALLHHIPGINSSLILDRLVSMHFVRREAKRYFLHPADRDYALSRMPAGDPNKKVGQGARARTWDQQSLTLRAADYFIEARKPQSEWKRLDDLAPQLAEFDLRYSIGDYDTISNLLDDFDYDYLLLWGHYRLVIDLREKIYLKIKNPLLKISNFNVLGTAYKYVGEVKKSLEYLEQGLSIARNIKSRATEGIFLGNIGNVYYLLGDTQKAIELRKQAINISSEFDSQQEHGINLGNLGNDYFDLGDMKEAIKYLNEAYKISIKFQDRESECRHLGNLGYYYYIEFGDTERSEVYLIQSIQIADELDYIQVQFGSRWRLAQIYLAQENLTNAFNSIGSTLLYDVPVDNHNATALHGIIALRQGEREIAQKAFAKSIAQADEILAKTPEYYSALDAKGLSICGFILCRGTVPVPNDAPPNDTGRGDPAPTMDDAIETFRKARKIAPHAGIVKQNLRLFDELVKCEGGEILKDVRNAVEGVE